MLDSTTTDSEYKLLDHHLAKDDGICGGEVRIKGTRIPVWGIANAKSHNLSDKRLLKMYPMITSGALRAAIKYAETQPEEMDRLIQENENA